MTDSNKAMHCRTRCLKWCQILRTVVILVSGFPQFVMNRSTCTRVDINDFFGFVVLGFARLSRRHCPLRSDPQRCVHTIIEKIG